MSDVERVETGQCRRFPPVRGGQVNVWCFPVTECDEYASAGEVPPDPAPKCGNCWHWKSCRGG